MLFLNREAELGRLDEVMRGREGRLAVLQVLRALFVTAAPQGKPRSIEGVQIVTAAELLR
jgi:hypothetical protein